MGRQRDIVSKIMVRVRELVSDIPHQTICVQCGLRQETRWLIEPVDDWRVQVCALPGLRDWANYVDDPGREKCGWHCPRCYRARQLRETEDAGRYRSSRRKMG